MYILIRLFKFETTTVRFASRQYIKYKKLPKNRKTTTKSTTKPTTSTMMNKPETTTKFGKQYIKFIIDRTRNQETATKSTNTLCQTPSCLLHQNKQKQ